MTSHGEIRVTGSHPILLIGAKWTKADVLNSYNDIVYNLSLEYGELANEGIIANGIVVGEYQKQMWLR